MDGAMVVALGMGCITGLSVGDAGACPGADPATLQQIYTLARRQLEGAFIETCGANGVSGQEHSAYGWEQTFTPFERILYRIRRLPENRAVRYPGRAIGRTGT